MIVLTRHNGKPLVVNADLIETVETTDDGATTVVLTTGNVLEVRETPAAVRERALAYRRHIAGVEEARE